MLSGIQIKNRHCIYSRKKHVGTTTDINIRIKKNAISNIAISIGKFISDNDYEEISTININAECGYYLVKWTSDS